VARVRFQGKGFTEEEAERNCELMIVKELFDFDAVKEAAIELYSGDRKVGIAGYKYLKAKAFWLTKR